MASEVRLHVCLWKSYLTTLCLSLLIYKMGIIPELIGFLWGFDELIHIKYSEQCLKPNKLCVSVAISIISYFALHRDG